MVPWSLRSFAIVLVMAFSASASPVLAATTITATPDSVSGSAPVAATAGLPASGATAGTSQVITQSFNPTYLQVGNQAQVTAPEGWSLSYSSDGSTFGAAPSTTGEWAAVRAVRASGTVAGASATGGAASRSIPAPPSGSFSAAGGGDGWNVFFDDRDHVYNIWHHNGDLGYTNGGLGAIDCHTRTGASCGPGWPFYMSADGTSTGGSASRVLNTGVQSPGWVDNANDHLWFPTNDNATSTGVACVDVSDLANGPTWCGGSHSAAFITLGTAGRNNYSDNAICSTGTFPGSWGCVSGLATSGTRLYTVESRTGNVLCVDMAANGGLGAPCSGQPFSFTGASAAPTIWNGGTGYTGSWIPALLNVNGNILGTGLGSFTSTANPVLFCLTGSTGAACPGWTTPKSLPAGTWLTYAEPDATGGINGVCSRPVTTTSAGSPSCFSISGSSFTGNSAIGNDFRQTVNSENAAGSAITVGPRVLWGNGDFPNAGAGKVFCSDAATSASCTGWPLSPYDNYTIVVDPANDGCFWTNSHAGTIAQVSTDGTSGCAGVPPTSATFTPSSLVGTERVSCTSTPAWGTLAVTSPAQGTYTSATLTVLTASNAVVVSGGVTWQNIPVVNGTVDLSRLAQADTGANPQFIVNFTGRTNSDPIATTITSPAHAPQLCITLTPQEVACSYPGAPGGSLFPWTTAVTASGTQGSTSLSASEATVSFSGASTTACAAPATPDVDPAPSRLAVRILPSRRTLKSGQTMRIGIRTRNPGPSPSVNTRSCIVLPSNFVIVRTNGALRTGRTVCFALDDMGVGTEKTRVIVVRAVSTREVTRRLTAVARSANAYSGQVARAISRAPVTTIIPRTPRVPVTG